MPLLPDTIARVDRPVGEQLERAGARATIAGACADSARRTASIPTRPTATACGPPATRRPAPATSSTCWSTASGDRRDRAAIEAARDRTSTSPAGTSRPPSSWSATAAPRTTLRDLLAELAERVDVRVLLWAGPPPPVFEPKRSDVSGSATS